MQLQYGLIRVDRAKGARETNPIEINELIEEQRKEDGLGGVLKCKRLRNCGKVPSRLT